MRAMRNRFAHEYIGMDKSFVWEVVVNDIPVLKAFCEKQLADSSGERLIKNVPAQQRRDVLILKTIFPRGRKPAHPNRQQAKPAV